MSLIIYTLAHYLLHMILIADSGSTKIDWRLIDDDTKIHQCCTQGFNPYNNSSEILSSIIKYELLHHFSQLNSQSKVYLYFYGAGCGATSNKDIVKTALHKEFPLATIEVNTDLLAAARATSGTNVGLVAILGTGANTCYYNGKGIIENIASLGYLLGDEGSGAHLGKTFIQSYLNKEMPEDLAIRFYERFKIGKYEILDAVYKQPNPNRFLASFSKFIYQNLKEQFVVDLVVDCFNQFFDKYICKYQKHNLVKLSCVGSVAFYYSNILRAVAANKGVSIDTIIEAPIAGLTLYHLEVSKNFN